MHVVSMHMGKHSHMCGMYAHMWYNTHAQALINRHKIKTNKPSPKGVGETRL